MGSVLNSNTDAVGKALEQQQEQFQDVYVRFAHTERQVATLLLVAEALVAAVVRLCGPSPSGIHCTEQGGLDISAYWKDTEETAPPDEEPVLFGGDHEQPTKTDDTAP